MSIEQTKLIQEIMYYRIKPTTEMLNIIAQITDNKILNQIDMYIHQNHSQMNQECLKNYLEEMLEQMK